ncbi:MAG: TIGR02646 family protein [Ignavibacteriae bacterium]|nr:TIGR02646 family protein [Ignavibacteriota bacterium]
MLNITRRFSLSKKSKAIIKKHKIKNGGILKIQSWDKISKKVKNEISKKLFSINGFKCTYCERDLVGLTPGIDHLANKAAYPEFTFVPVNLFYSCNYCNSSSVKGQKETINKLSPFYSHCDFKIVHPYYDNPDSEIFYQDIDRIFIDYARCTQKGKNTIDFFNLSSYIMTNIRSRQLILERLNPLLPSDEKKLINETIAYK